MSDGIKATLRRLDAEIAAITDRVQACVDLLRLADEDARYLVMQRLPQLGTMVIEPARQLAFDETAGRDVRVLAALVAVDLGDVTAAPALLEETRRAGDLSLVAARVLARHSVEGAVDAVLAAIRATSLDDVDKLVAFLFALRDLGEMLPASERERLAGGPWQVTTAMNEAFPNDET